MGRKKELKAAVFESASMKYRDRNGTERKESFAKIYETMLRSQAWRSLTDRQRLLYLYCKAQFMGKRKPREDYKGVPGMADDRLFYLTWLDVQEYGTYTDSEERNFRKDISALIEKGFIRKTVAGCYRSKKAVYMFDSKWHEQT